MFGRPSLARFGFLLSFALCCCQAATPRPGAPAQRSDGPVDEPEPAASLEAPSPPDPKQAPTRVSLAGAPKASAVVDGRAESGVVGVLVGMRERRTDCYRVLELRLLNEVELQGATPRTASETSKHETGALLLLPPETEPPGAARCARRFSARFGLDSLSVGDRVAISLGRAPFSSVSSGFKPHPWQLKPGVRALAGVHRLPELMRTLPLPTYDSDGEQSELVSPHPLPGTPESARQLDKHSRFEQRAAEVLDHALGIAWQRKAFDKPLHLFEAAWACEAASTGGHDDWRLPTARELQTAFISPSAPTVAGPRWLDQALFGSARDSLWWTRTDDDGYYVGIAESGEVASTHYDSPDPYGPHGVRCVRDATSRRSLPLDQFRKAINTLHDPFSGLEWQLPAKPLQRTQEAAKNRCERATFDGHDDWRLPTHAEALSLMSRCPTALFEWSEESDVRSVWLDGKSADGKYPLASRICAYAPTPIGVFDSEELKAHSLCVRANLSQQAKPDVTCPAGTTLRHSPASIECVKGAVREGPFVAFYPSGALFERSEYHAGKRDGSFTLYHEHGLPWVKGAYAAGRLDGEIVASRSNGERRTTQRFGAGVPSGTWHFYGPEQREVEWLEMKGGEPNRGQLSERLEGGDARSSPTRRGLPHGIEEVRLFDSDYTRRSVIVLGALEGDYEVVQEGQVTQRGTYRDGLEQGLWVRSVEEGEERATYERGVLHGPYIALDALGEVVERREYERGKPWGKWVLKDGKGQVVQRCDLDEQGNGTFTLYGSDGHKLREEPFRNGLLEGKLKTFWSGGKLESETPYRAGKIEGRVVEYSQAGQLLGFDTYRGGLLEGPSEERYENGELSRRGSYTAGKRSGQWLFVLPTGARFEVSFVAGKPVHGAWE